MKSFLPLTRLLCCRQTLLLNQYYRRNIISVTKKFKNAEKRKAAALPTLKFMDEHFDSIPLENRNKEAFLQAVSIFQQKRTHLRGHVEFIYSALKRLEEFNLHKDLDTYKTLLNIFPKGALVPRNSFQVFSANLFTLSYATILLYQSIGSDGMRNQSCIKGVQPDREVHDIVVNAFGAWNFATRKIKRMLYWMPKLKHTNKYLDRREIEGKNLSMVELAFLALKVICRDPGTHFSQVKIKDMDIDEKENWFVSGQSPLQKVLIERLKPKTTVYVDGPFFVYLLNYKVFYVTLTADPNPTHVFDNFRPEEEEDDNFEDWVNPWEGGPSPRPERNIHEQQDETVLGLAVFGKNDRKWVASWINHLLETNPNLNNVKVLIRLKEESKGMTSAPPPDLKKRSSEGPEGTSY